jgi:hypothetical protein
MFKNWHLNLGLYTLKRTRIQRCIPEVDFVPQIFNESVFYALDKAV